MAKPQVKRKTTGTPKVVSSKPRNPPLSSERVVDSSESDSDSSSENAANLKALSQRSAAAKSSTLTNGRKSTDSDTGSNESGSRTSNGAETSEVDEPESESERSSAAVSKSEDLRSESVDESDSDSGSGSGSGSESDSGSESKNENEKRDQDVTWVRRIEPTHPFEPPLGFKALEIVPGAIPESNALFDPSRLAGKQLWHISAPASVPLTDLKEAALDRMTKGEAIISHNGTQYGLVHDQQLQQNIALLLPGTMGYVRAQTNVFKSFKLSQVVGLPEVNLEPSTQIRNNDEISSLSARPIKPARPQPKGLRMRYRPPGFGSDDPGNIGWSDSEVEDSTAPKQPPQPKKTVILPPGCNPNKHLASTVTPAKPKMAKILPPGYRPPPENALEASNSVTKRDGKEERRKRKEAESKEDMQQKKKKKKKKHDKDARDAQRSTKVS